MKNKAIVCILTALSVLAAMAFCADSFSPMKKAMRFVKSHSAAFCNLVDSGNTVPSAWEGASADVWDGEHLVYELVLGHGLGDTQYYGVYYSPDDTPMPFQNAGASLSADGQEGWHWQGEGDNHGATKRIAPCWFYFEATL